MQFILSSVSMIAVIAFCTTVVAEAQSRQIFFSAAGQLAAGATDHTRGADIFLFGNATARLSLKNTPLGFEVGVYGLANAVDTPHETYGTFTWNFANGGKLFLGVPRPAYDSFAISAVDTLFPSLGVSNTAATRSQATFGAMFAGYLPYGIRFENETNMLRYAVSFETVPNRDLTIASFGFGLPIGGLTLQSAVEMSSGAKKEVAGKVQITGAVGRIDGGLGLYLGGTSGRSDMLEAFASFDPTEKITVAGILQIPLTGPDDLTAGVSARYAFSPTVGFSAGVLSDAGAASAYSVLLNWAF